ncbi:MAG: riboflavin biosynthesis protein RibF [Firmicutes bacterium]|nr:riboflavin biosynthesis protein RibF [Bacillota bacterium]
MKKIILALGFFDAIHKGHRLVLGKAVEMAKELNAQVVALTFSDEFGLKFKSGGKVIYTYAEREFMFKEMGLNCMMADVHENFDKLSAESFLNLILSQDSVAGVVCGSDYTFGEGGLGNAQMLKNEAELKGIRAEIVTLYKEEGKKVASSDIKNLILCGELERANELLYKPFSVYGEVVKGEGRGKIYGFPTANIVVCDKKLLPPDGVYITETVDLNNNVLFNSITNVGKKPTFSDNEITVETMMLNFNGNLYGNILEVNFHKKIRGVIKFSSAEELKNQIDCDTKTAISFFKECGLYD